MCLPAAGLGWEKDAEAVTAKYNDKSRGRDPDPSAVPHTDHRRAATARYSGAAAGAWPQLSSMLLTRREGIADGGGRHAVTFTADAVASALAENTHMHQIASTDKAMATPEVIETRQTFGTLANTIILFSGLLCAAALLLGVFLGGGRALIRVLRGKPPATEMEFLSLHLDPQNPTPIFASED